MANSVIFNNGNDVGIGTTKSGFKLEISGTTSIADRTIGINGTPVVYLPDQGTAIGQFHGSLALGNGLRFLSGTAVSHGKNNTAVGVNALLSNTTGNRNTAIGNNALHSNTTGSTHIAIGYQALYHTTSGPYNVAIGIMPLRSNTTGSHNTALGFNALSGNTIGNYNTAIGLYALNGNSTGFQNTAIGFDAGVTSGDLQNITAIGRGAKVDSSNKVRIGNTNVTWIGGQVGWTIASDGRFKNEIEDIDLGLDFINQLRPVSYKRISGDDNRIDYGFIAQEVEAILNGKNTNIVLTDNTEEQMKSITYEALIAPLVKSIQEQQRQIDELRMRLDQLE